MEKQFEQLEIEFLSTKTSDEEYLERSHSFLVTRFVFSQTSAFGGSNFTERNSPEHAYVVILHHA